MRVGMLIIMLVIGFGCAGPDVSQPHGVAASSGNACPSGRLSSGMDRAGEGRCLSPSAGWTRVGEALSGAATVVRMPRP